LETLEALRQKVREVCARYRCIYALIFGSWARGEARPYSDLDVAVMLEGNKDALFETIVEMTRELEHAVQLRVNVVVLNTADSVLKYEVFSHGVLVYCRDYTRFLDDKINAIDEYLDFQPHFERFFERTVKEIQHAATRCKSTD